MKQLEEFAARLHTQHFHFITWLTEDFFLGDTAGLVPSEQDSAILPAQVANHSAGFGSSCLLTDIITDRVFSLWFVVQGSTFKHMLKCYENKTFCASICHKHYENMMKKKSINSLFPGYLPPLYKSTTSREKPFIWKWVWFAWKSAYGRNAFSHVWCRPKTRFETEAQGDSFMESEAKSTIKEAEGILEIDY